MTPCWNWGVLTFAAYAYLLGTLAHTWLPFELRVLHLGWLFFKKATR